VSACTAKAGTCPIDGGVLAYETRGAGPPLVLLHGFSFDMRAWDAQIDRLAEHHRVIRYDLRGFGRSTLPCGNYSHSEDLGLLLEELAVEKPVLVGLSLGANVALEYSLRYPSKVRAQVLASPGLVGYTWTEERPPEAAAAHAAAHGVASAKRFWLNHRLFAPLRRDRAALSRLRVMVQEYSGWHWQHPNPVRATKAVDRLGECRIPTLVASGKLDVNGYRVIAALLSAKINNAASLWFENAGHVVNDEADAAFVDAVLKFADQVES
jgi:3-oxoadipate enol-lactonase